MGTKVSGKLSAFSFRLSFIPQGFCREFSETVAHIFRTVWSHMSVSWFRYILGQSFFKKILIASFHTLFPLLTYSMEQSPS
jgi:hypothetical protein